MKVRTNLDSKTTSQFPPPSMGGPRESSYRGLSAVGVLDKPRVGRIRRSSVEESDAKRTTVNGRFPRGVRDHVALEMGCRKHPPRTSTYPRGRSDIALTLRRTQLHVVSLWLEVSPACGGSLSSAKVNR